MLLMIVAAVAAMQEAPAAGPPTAAQFREGVRLLDEGLLDYPSARFRDVKGNDLVLCGFVNAKNRMSAYTGWERFALLNTSEPRLLIARPGNSDDILLDTFCGADGLKMQGPDYSTRIAQR